jgi:hypothetical protein
VADSLADPTNPFAVSDAGGVLTAFWVALFVAAGIGLIVLSSRMEPHWCAKDVSAFTCRVQELTLRGDPITRWQDARAVVVDDAVSVTRKTLMRPTGPEPPRRVLLRAPAAPSGRAVFLLDGQPQLALRVPQRSPAVARLEAIAEGPGGIRSLG